MKADLHNHSYFSDGFLSPSEVVKLAASAKCDLFSLTDHDTTDGLAEAQLEAEKVGLKLINGVEISSYWQNSAIHIVGLGIDIDNDILQSGLEFNKTLRKERAKKIKKERDSTKYIEKQNIKNPDDLLKIAAYLKKLVLVFLE